MSKVACETAAAIPDANAGAVQLCGRGGAGSGSGSPRADEAGAPAESVLLRVPNGVGLSHFFGAALRRDGSTKGSSNPKAAAEAATRKGPPRADSRRSSATTTATVSSSKTAAAVVFGVLLASKVVVAKERRRAPAPGSAVVAARASWRRSAAGARVFASEAVGPPEPVSPKVSCFGAVLSETAERSAAAPPGPGTQEEEEQGSGCWASLRTALLLGLCRDDSKDREGHPCRASEPNSKAGTAPEVQRQRVVAVMSPPRPVAGLGDVKRLASRRWPETMAPGTV